MTSIWLMVPVIFRPAYSDVCLDCIRIRMPLPAQLSSSSCFRHNTTLTCSLSLHVGLHFVYDPLICGEHGEPSASKWWKFPSFSNFLLLQFPIMHHSLRTAEWITKTAYYLTWYSLSLQFCHLLFPDSNHSIISSKFWRYIKSRIAKHICYSYVLLPWSHWSLALSSKNNPYSSPYYFI